MKNWKCIYLIMLIPICFSCDQSEKTSEVSTTSQAQKSNRKGNKFVIDDHTPYREDSAKIRRYSRSIKQSSKIKPSQAAYKLFKYKEWADIADNDSIDESIDFKNVNYGYLFTFEELRDYINEVDAYNKNQTDPLLKIVGIRVYQGAVRGSGNTYIPDVFLYPATPKGNAVDIDLDYPTLLRELAEKGSLDEFLEKLNKHSATSYGSGFNSSVPCPQSCP